MTAAGDGPDPDAGGREIGLRVQEAYATRVGVDTAARHLWSMDREARRLRGRRRRQRLVSAVASLLLLLVGAGTVAGSAAALPGETLYPVKESLERAELSIAFSDTANARAHLRHSRVRLDELRQAAESNPELVPEIAERFFASLDRAAELGGDAVAAEVAALRTSASLLMDRLARDLDPSIAQSLRVARAPHDDSASADRGGTEAAADDGATVGPVGEPSSRGPGGGDGGSGSGSGTAEPLTPQPETSVAETGQDQGQEAGERSEELPEETATVELPPETVEVTPREPTGSSSDPVSSDEDEPQDGDASQQADPGDEADQDGQGATSPKTAPRSSSTAQAGSSDAAADQDEGDG